jgi:hypothetical protein
MLLLVLINVFSYCVNLMKLTFYIYLTSLKIII